MKLLMTWPWRCRRSTAGKCFLIYLAWIFKLLIFIIRVENAATLKDIIRIADGSSVGRDAIEQSLVTIHDISTENLGTLCISTLFRPLQVPLNSERYESSRQKADLAASILQEVGIIRHGGLSDALAKGLLTDEYITGARIIALNMTNGAVQSYVWWTKNVDNNAGEYTRYEEEGLQIGKKPVSSYPWYDDETSTLSLHSPKFAKSPPNIYYKGWWTFPYLSCNLGKWILSYSIAIPPVGRHGLRGFISIDIDVTSLRVNQCESPKYRFNYQQIQSRRFHLVDTQMTESISDIQAFHGSHKCHSDTMECQYRIPVESPTITNKIIATPNGWTRGSYQCLCKRGFYSVRHPDGFNGTVMEIAWQEQRDNMSNYYTDVFVCYQCAPGCGDCHGPEPCLASYNWPFRISLLTVSVGCALSTIVLAGYLFHHRKVKVFKVASPIFLLITLIGCAIMYMEMAAIFPILDTYWCVATKWTRHMGFCITYTSLLMKTWRVSLTYRVKSAHKVKLTDQQLLQWMVPILLVMLIYLGTWTISATPFAEVEYYRSGKRGKIYNKYSNLKFILKTMNTPTSSKPRSEKTVDVDTDTEVEMVPEENAETCYQALRFDNLSSEEFDRCWKACSKSRLTDIKNSTTTSDIFKKWPQYKIPSGFRFVDMDFAYMFKSHNSLLDRWEQVFTKIREFLKTEDRVKEKTIKGVLEKIASDNIPENCRDAALLWALHGYLVPTHKFVRKDRKGMKTSIKPTIKDSQESFIFVAGSIQVAEDHIQYLQQKGDNVQPFIILIHDQDKLKFKQCSYNWWDHSLAIGEVLFLAWGIRVCYNVRNAESLYNEARLISYAIYNIAIVNITMIAFHLFIFPQAGPDIKYLLGFIRTQLSTTVTVVLVFGPKISRVFKGQGDQWDNKARVRSITASFSLNGVGLVPEESPDLYQENEELKEQIQKLAHQIEFMKTVHMQMNNRHLKPKPGGYFTITSTSFQAPFTKTPVLTAQTQTSKGSSSHHQQRHQQHHQSPVQPPISSCISDDGISGTNSSIGANSIGFAAAPSIQTPQIHSVKEKV